MPGENFVNSYENPSSFKIFRISKECDLQGS